MSNVIGLDHKFQQQKSAQRKAVTVDLSSKIMAAVDKYDPDILFPSLCAVYAQQIKKRVHPTNLMNAIAQVAQEVHRMVFDPETQAQANSIKEEVLVELDEITRNANRWVTFKRLYNGWDFNAPFAKPLDTQKIEEEIDREIEELEEAAKRISAQDSENLKSE